MTLKELDRLFQLIEGDLDISPWDWEFGYFQDFEEGVVSKLSE